MKAIVIDLRYRGDYTRKTRAFVQPSVVNNDLTTLTAVLSDREKWAKVPEDRFKRRAAFAKSAAENGK